MNPTGRGPSAPGGWSPTAPPANPRYAQQQPNSQPYANPAYAQQRQPNPHHANPAYAQQQQPNPHHANPAYAQQPYPNQAHPNAAPTSGPQGAPSASDPAEATRVLGFELVQGERLLMATRPSASTGGLWFAAMVFSLVLFGLILVALALSGEKGRPRIYALTSMRLVTVDASGKATSYWFQSYGDVDPIRADVNAGGGGVLGAVISVAVSAGANALADRSSKLAPGYWTRTIGFLFKDASGATVRVPIGPEAGVLAYPLAQVLLTRSADHLRTLELQHVQRPRVGGGGAQIFGVWAVLLAFAFVAYANAVKPAERPCVRSDAAG
jgi:hypothetical protein